MNKDIQVDLNAIIETLEMLSITGDFTRSFVNMHTDRIVSLFDGEDFSDLEGEDLEGDHYASLPDMEELNEYEIMEKFCCAITNEKIQEDLLCAIQVKGAFGRFKTCIHCHNIEDNEAIARLLCPEKSMILKPVESSSGAATIHSTRSTPGRVGRGERTQMAAKGRF